MSLCWMISIDDNQCHIEYVGIMLTEEYRFYFRLKLHDIRSAKHHSAFIVVYLAITTLAMIVDSEQDPSYEKCRQETLWCVNLNM